MTAYPNLFSPFMVGRRTLKNRVVHASMSTHYADRGRVTPRLIDYYVNRARGGTAMLVTEPMAMLSHHKLPTRPAVLSGINEGELTRWADLVGAEGGLMLGQIQDNGRGFRAGFRNPDAIGPSALPDDLSWTVPHALSADEIRRMIDEFAFCATRLQAAGFAGVEISAGHGHLFHQFLAARSNVRDDDYGGDLPRRTRLLTDLMLALRDACGDDFIIGVKLPAEDGMEGGIDLDIAAQITDRVHATGVMDYLTYCWGAHGHTLYEHLPDLHGPRTPFVDRIAALGKHAPGVPLGALGLITDPNEGERIVRDGLGDLVMMGRPLVTDPAWAVKAEQGREAQIRYCVSCNTCWHMINIGRGLHCDNNPRVGAPDEADWRPEPVAAPKRVVVVGGGIAGMEAAWVAAARGHTVTLFSAGDEAGGKTRLHALLPGGENLSSIYDYQRLSAERAGAVFHWGTTAGADDILALAPDHVVLATGATPGWPDYLPAEYRGEGFFPDLRQAMADLTRLTARQAGTAVIHDADHGAFTYAAAELLKTRYDRVIILTERERIASDEAMVTRQGVYARLYAKDIEIVTSVRPLASSRFEEGEVAYANIFSGRETVIADVALFTYATARIPDDALAAPLRAAGIDVRTIGDAHAPRTVLVATAEGYRTAMEF
ncbi:2,4-dienoyl-CoA reductase-like NADH-dependent reductase (Old Yellow Enzyme family) [Sphingomonas zeicaulis]|uniref:oxidoreductase n=1 Tax=Sphingomonas zeicaulis TaxID=1632740 RepID=UPI003D25B35A